jgi:CRISPR-associated endonuclease/helicase Cas3
MTHFLNFWGKAQPAEGVLQTWHPAACHCLDVAAAAEALLTSNVAMVDRVAQVCGWAVEDVIQVVVFLVALHDVGKFSRSFQAKAADHWPACLGPFRDIPGPRHDAVGLELLHDDDILDVLLDVFLNWKDEQIELLFAAVAGHHGRPVQRLMTLKTDIVCAPCLIAACAFVVAVRGLLDPPKLSPPPDMAAEMMSWWLAGLTTLCDWIGSATCWFPYVGDGCASLAEYWPEAQRRAKCAIQETGLLPAATGTARRLGELMPFIETPTPVQMLAEQAALPDGPICVIIEDATGGGKTEAALMLAQRLIADGRADGLFIALPTMATADAMFDRLAESYRRLFAAEGRPSLALAHGRAALNDLFQGTIMGKAATAMAGEAADVEETSSAQCAAWLAQERRRVFFAHVGVGTIDQALLGALAARHAALRLFGLSQKVLVVDEAHAYDPYMAEELDRLLMFHAMLGGSTIILSATLPRARRATLLRAVGTGLGAPPHLPTLTNYPLLTFAGREGSFESDAEMRDELRRDLPVRRLTSVAAAVAELVKAARAGACCIWVRNTVDDARAGAQALREAGITPILFHARFAMGDRLAIQKQVLEGFGKTSTDRAPGGIGRVLVATQVVEQSLDLDADVMVTDLAPIDLLIQRAGRLHRHPKRIRPPGFGSPELLVVSPEPIDLPDTLWATDPSIGGTHNVYPPHILWRSARALFTAGAIGVPDGVRPLVEAVYGEDAEALPGALLTGEAKTDGKSIAERGHARANLLEPRQGYSYGGGPWDSDVVMPTRLGDEYVAFRMVREERGAVVPFCLDDEPKRAWALSEITLRRSIADAQVVPERLAPALDQLREGWTKWQREIPVLVLEPGETDGWTAEACCKEKAVRLSYTRASGLYVANR